MVTGIFALIALLAIAGAVIVLSPRQAPPNQEHTQQSEAKEANDEGKAEKNQAISRRQLWVRTLNDPVALFTAVLALFSGGLLAVAGLQIWLLVRSENVARESANAAKKAAQAAENSLIKLQRPFIGLQQIRYLSHRDLVTNKVFWTFHVLWENSGGSPTKNLRFYVHRYLSDKDIPTDYKFALSAEPRPITHLMPNAVKGTGELPVTGDDLVAVREGKKFLYLWGRADYRDLFDGTPDHVTKFFIRILVRGDPNQEWDVSTDRLELTFLNQPKHNCADEECDE